MTDDEKMLFTLQVGSDKRVIESGINVTKEDFDSKTDLVKDKLKERLTLHVNAAVDQLFGPPKEDAVPVEEPKKEEEEPVKEEKKEEPTPVEEKKEDAPPVEEKKEEVEEKKEEAPPAEEKKEEAKPAEEEKKEDAA